MSAPSPRCGSVIPPSERAKNADTFFDRMSALLDAESVATTNGDDVDLPLRAQMRLATDHLQQLIRFARQFHQCRFSDDPQRCGKAAEVAWKFVHLHNKLHRGDVGTEFVQMVTLFDRRATYTPQPDFFGFHHKSWAGVVNKIMLPHYCLFDDAFEAAELSEGDTTDEQDIEESESSLWTPETFAELCHRFDEHEILSFNASSWPAEQEPDKQSTVEPPPKGHREEHPYRFECGPAIVRIVGLGEDVTLERTEGVERLIAVVTKRRISVTELARIGSAQHGRTRNSVDVDADRLTERESVNDERFESRLGDDAPFAVREAVRELIARRDAAAARGADDEESELTAQINAALQAGKTNLQAAAGTVRKSLERTYERLREGDHGIALAKHFDTFVERPRKEPDFVYAPDESHGEIVWIMK